MWIETICLLITLNLQTVWIQIRTDRALVLMCIETICLLITLNLQTVWIQIRTDRALVPMWIETICLLITFANSSDPDQNRQSIGPDVDRNHLFADNLCKQLGSRSEPREHRPWSGSKLFDTLLVFLEWFFEKKCQQTTSKAWYYPVSKELTHKKPSIICNRRHFQILALFINNN